MRQGGVEEPIRDLYWSQTISNTGYNFKFKMMTYFEEYSSDKVIKKYEEVFLLGKKYSANPDTLQETNRQLYQQFSRIPWMTYRAIFPEMDARSKNYVTDTGWGCMVRVGQMLMAQTLKKHLKIKTKQEMIPILKLFDDYNQKQIFSIQNISKMARQQYDLEPGKWFNPSQIAYILSDLYRFEQSNPYKKTLDFVVLNNATLFYDQVIFRMCNIKQICKCKKKKVICYDCNKKEKSICLVVLARVGLQNPQKKYISLINKMMESQYFQGMIGGKPQKALYFVGKNFDQYIYLDPHNVQQGVSSQSLQRLYDTYFCKSFRSCKNTSIDPSVGLAFYFQNLQDVDNFYSYMKDLKQKQPEDFFLFSAIQTPQYMKTIEDQRNGLQTVETQIFQTL